MSEKTSLTLFIDGGGTKVRIWVRIDNDVILKEPKATEESHFSVGCHKGKILRSAQDDTSYAHIRASLKKFLRTLPHKPERAFVGFRGAWTPTEKKALRKKFSFAAHHVHAMSDIELAHRLAFGDQPGIILNAGTGSIAYGRNKKGKSARAGGFGPLIGDEGSAFWIGREALKARPSSTSEFMEIRKIVVKGDAVRRIAALAKDVLSSSSPECRRIQQEAQDYLKDLVERVRRELNIPKPAPLALEGGLFQNRRFRKDFEKRMKNSFVILNEVKDPSLRSG